MITSEKGKAKIEEPLLGGAVEACLEVCGKGGNLSRGGEKRRAEKISGGQGDATRKEKKRRLLLIKDAQKKPRY